MDQLCVLFTTGTNSQASRNGGLLGLAAAAIALGPDFSPYLPLIVPPILSCFSDPDSRMRYFGVECIVSGLSGISRSFPGALRALLSGHNEARGSLRTTP
jgi:hypothetical protein